MPQAKKFGAFAGVFTPSLLTILGVIMYMRLGWVVGEAGLITALVIILISHVISITTGLSISSIATDKKIRAGGIYYILSRSLGLPMGGAIGIALFIGTALSISLYLVGFAESFLGIDAIREFLGIEQNAMGYRIIGTAGIVVLVVLALISTSLAIKTQFYILGFIALSLVSIVVGFFMGTGDESGKVIITHATQAVPMEAVFAVFFPAVTGFTAGVAMSGDLKNPKKAIPAGTLFSIGTGLLVYVGLAVGFAFFVDRDLLLNDNNFLLHIAWFSPFVVAGIWGATLSSALGGILGGPRILQAMSTDRITPRVFAKTFGTNNEPRIALILIFIIAEGGILIGELNLIAGIVSMFYLASYGFINLAFFLESWASTDFRPTFRVNRYMGLIGFIAAFGVMFKLDMVSMFAALIIMWGLFFFLKRKNLKSSYGDVWQSVYSSVVKTALHRMDKQEEVERNWKPNIILFSGGNKKRPHLLEFGKYIVGKHGVMSNFELIESNEKKLLPKRNQSVTDALDDSAIFTRKKTVKDIYEGIETIASVYGFSGFEPNTVLMGWGRQTKNPERFVEMLNSLYELDLNVLMLDYDKRFGFGNFQTIDIWWRDVSNQGNLALSIAKLIILSSPWQHANVRLMIASSRNDQNENIFNRAAQLLENMRFHAIIKVINNEIENRSLYELMYSESKTSDLVIVGFPEIIRGQETAFVESTNRLLHQIGTVLLIKASSTFKKFKLDAQKQSTELEDSGFEVAESNTAYINISGFPEQQELRDEMKNQLMLYIRIIDDFQVNFILPSTESYRRMHATLEQAVADIFKTLESPGFINADKNQRSRIIAGLKTNFLVKTARISDEMQKTLIREQTEILRNGIENFMVRVGSTADLTPTVKSIRYYNDDLEIKLTDHSRTRLYKRWKRFLHSRRRRDKGIKYTIHLRKLFRSELPLRLFKRLIRSLDKLGREQVQAVVDFQKLVTTVNLAFETLSYKIEVNAPDKLIAGEKEKIYEALQKFTAFSKHAQHTILLGLKEGLTEAFDSMNEIATKIPPNYFMRNYPAKKIRQKTTEIKEAPVFLAEKLILLHNAAFVDIRISLIKFRIIKTVSDTVKEIEKLVGELIISKAEHVQQTLRSFIVDLENNTDKEKINVDIELSLPDKSELQIAIDKTTDKAFRNIKTVIGRLPKSSEFLSAESHSKLSNMLFEETESVKISIFQLVDFYIQYNLLEPMINSTAQLGENVLASMEKIRDILRRISFGKNKPEMLTEDADLFYDEKSFLDFVREQEKSVMEEIMGIKATLSNLDEDLDKTTQDVLNDLSIYRLLKTPEKYRRYLRRTEKVKKTIPQRLKRINIIFKEKTARLWHHQSDAILFAKRVTEADRQVISPVNALLNIHDKISPPQPVLNKLPFYYQQLFLRKYNYQNEFWLNRNNEIEEIKKAIDRHARGFSGGILVRGKQNSGKTFFVNYIASTQWTSKHTYYIPALPGGSANTETFVKTLQEATGINEPYLNIFARLPEDSMIIIDNLELWWERTPKGMEVIQLLSEIIQKFGSRQLFLFTVNTQSFDVINRMFDINRFFVNIVDLQPFNSRQLQEVILFRHRTGGLNMKLSHKQSGIFQTTDIARLFSKYFNYSNGNIGAALLAWVANIIEVRDKEIEAGMPQIPDLTALRELSPAIKLYLTQFILHKRCDFAKLQRITLDTEEEVEKNIRFMKRAGLISETAGHVYEIDKYMYVHIHKVLYEETQQIR